MAISGTTDLLALIADSVARARTPGLVNEELAARGCDAVLVALRVPAAGLADVVRAWRAIDSFRGAVVSMPHNEAIVPLLDELAPEAAATGACNTVRRDPDGRLVGTRDGAAARRRGARLTRAPRPRDAGRPDRTDPRFHRDAEDGLNAAAERDISGVDGPHGRRRLTHKTIVTVRSELLGG